LKTGTFEQMKEHKRSKFFTKLNATAVLYRLILQKTQKGDTCNTWNGSLHLFIYTK